MRTTTSPPLHPTTVAHHRHNGETKQPPQSYSTSFFSSPFYVAQMFGLAGAAAATATPGGPMPANAAIVAGHADAQPSASRRRDVAAGQGQGPAPEGPVVEVWPEPLMCFVTLDFPVHCKEKPFAVNLPIDPYTRIDMEREPYCFYVEALELATVRLANCSPGCVGILSFSHPLLRRQGFSDGNNAANGLAGASEPISSILLPTPKRSTATMVQHLLYQTHIEHMMPASKPDERRRALRYGDVHNAADLLSRVAFDDTTGLYMPPPAGHAEPLIVTVLLRAQPALQRDKLRREDFLHICGEIDQYLAVSRSQFVYCGNLEGSVRVTESPASVTLCFLVRFARLRNTTVSAAPAAQQAQIQAQVQQPQPITPGEPTMVVAAGRGPPPGFEGVQK